MTGRARARPGAAGARASSTSAAAFRPGATRWRREPRRGPPAGAGASTRYAEAITGALRDGLAEAGVDASGIQLEVEPGRSLYADTGIHLATVRHVKAQDEPVPLRWVETDSSEIFVADVVFERNRWRALVVNRADARRLPRPPTSSGSAATRTSSFPTPSCPRSSRATSIALLDTGAYQEANASNFNALPRPATVLVNGAEAEVIKRAETIADVFARDRGARAAALGSVPVGNGVAGARARPRLGQLLGPRSLARLLRRAARDPGDGPRRARGRGGQRDHRRSRTGGRALPTSSLGDGRVLELIEFTLREVTPVEARTSTTRAPDICRCGWRRAAETHAALVAAGAPVRSEPVELDRARLLVRRPLLLRHRPRRRDGRDHRASVSREVITVTGPVAPEDLGITSMHEHALADGRAYAWAERTCRPPALGRRGRAGAREPGAIARQIEVNRDNLLVDDPEMGERRAGRVPRGRRARRSST